MKMDVSSFLSRKGLRQRELANIVGVETSTVGGWCTGRIYPSFDKVCKLLEIGMTVEELFGREIACKTSVFVEDCRCFDSLPNFDPNDPAVKSVMKQVFSDMLLKAVESISDKR